MFANDLGLDNDGGSVLGENQHLVHEAEGFWVPSCGVGRVFEEAVGVGAVESAGGGRGRKRLESATRQDSDQCCFVGGMENPQVAGVFGAEGVNER